MNACGRLLGYDSWGDFDHQILVVELFEAAEIGRRESGIAPTVQGVAATEKKATIRRAPNKPAAQFGPHKIRG